ncbi:STAS domain-containing protein [Azohydromonas australica]|uniref:STAS domain-containing protein n=1 Tax=Azohydromonas australica TaxID=364039 RepID=UPI00041BA1AD|nr:STAS domain-containing protein [Azohydromonas australica]
MKIDVQQREQALVATVQAPRLDAAQAAAFRTALLDVLKDTPTARLVLDLQAVKMIDSSGLGVLVSVLKSMGGRGGIAVAGASAAVQSVFKLTRLDRVFPMHDSVDAALAA